MFDVRALVRVRDFQSSETRGLSVLSLQQNNLDRFAQNSHSIFDHSLFLLTRLGRSMELLYA